MQEFSLRDQPGLAWHVGMREPGEREWHGKLPEPQSEVIGCTCEQGAGYHMLPWPLSFQFLHTVSVPS
jgi:hypothetical protein